MKHLSAEHRTYLIEKYLAGVSAFELAPELLRKFGVSVTAGQLRQFVSRSGLAARKQEVDAKVVGLVSNAKVNALAKARAALPAAHMADWAEKSVTVTAKAFHMCEEASRPRELASAVSAANTAVRMYRLLAGIDGTESGPRAMKFNFNFANVPAVRAAAALVSEVQPLLADVVDEVELCVAP